VLPDSDRAIPPHYPTILETSVHEEDNDISNAGRRDFLKTVGAGLTAGSVLMTPRERALAQTAAEKARLDRIASNTWPVRSIFKTRQVEAAAVRARVPVRPVDGDRADAAPPTARRRPSRREACRSRRSRPREIARRRPR
jgi:hypothetical protein